MGGLALWIQFYLTAPHTWLSQHSVMLKDARLPPQFKSEQFLRLRLAYCVLIYDELMRAKCAHCAKERSRVEWTLHCTANSLRVLSPLLAAATTCALKMAP